MKNILNNKINKRTLAVMLASKKMELHLHQKRNQQLKKQLAMRNAAKLLRLRRT